MFLNNFKKLSTVMPKNQSYEITELRLMTLIFLSTVACIKDRVNSLTPRRDYVMRGDKLISQRMS